MKRRTFLKSIATVCGVAVVCPGELLKTDPWIKAATLRKKNAAMGKRLKFGIGERSKHIYIYGKHYIMCNKRSSGFIVTPYETT